MKRGRARIYNHDEILRLHARNLRDGQIAQRIGCTSGCVRWVVMKKKLEIWRATVEQNLSVDIDQTKIMDTKAK